MKFKTGDLLLITKNKSLRNEPDLLLSFSCLQMLYEGDIAIVLSNKVESGFINVATSLGDGWIFEEFGTLEKVY